MSHIAYGTLALAILMVLSIFARILLDAYQRPLHRRLILLALRHKRTAYAVELRAITSIGPSIYNALHELEHEGLIDSHFVHEMSFEESRARGGRPRRYYYLTQAGKKALDITSKEK